MNQPTTQTPRRRLLRRLAWIIGAPCALLLISLLSVNIYIYSFTSDRVHDTLQGLPAELGVAIVLGAHVQEDGQPSPALTDRMAAALDLYNAHLVHHILITGDNSAQSHFETDVMRAWFIDRSVPASALWTDPHGVRTLDSFVRAAQIFDISRAIICTQGFHLPRSLFLAHVYGIDAHGYAADRQPYRKAPIFWLREQIARPLAVLDVHVLHTLPVRGGSTEGVMQ